MFGKNLILFGKLLFCSVITGLKATKPYAKIRTKSERIKGMSKNKNQKFQIFAWIAPPHEGVMGQQKAYNTVEHYRKIAECGIDWVIDVFDSFRPDLNGEIEHSLQSARASVEAGVKYLSADGGLSEGIPTESPAKAEQTVRAYCDELLKEGAAGHNVYDEPSSIGTDRRTVPQIFEYLGNIHEIYRRNYPDKLFYVNLLPRACLPGKNYWNDFEISGRDEYEKEYVEAFVKTVKPEFISFDQYNLLTAVNRQDYVLSGADDRSLGSQIWTGYLENLEVFSHVSKEYGIPFYAFVQTTEHWAGTSRHIRYPQAEDIRYQIGCQLAFGSQGVEYFTYWSARAFPGYGDGCTDAFGNPTQHYFDVQRLNRELQFLAPHYFRYHYMGTMAIGGKNAEQPNPDFALLRYSLKEYRALHSVECSEDTLIGLFENENGFALCLVNVTDPFFGKEDKIELNFARESEILSIYREKTELLRTEQGRWRGLLPAGSYQFIMVQNR